MKIKHYATNFVKCGMCGWSLECLWTGCHEVAKHTHKDLPCKTSIWMFPIYGMAFFLEPISHCVKKKNALVRGTVYTLFIYLAEYGTGSLLKKMKCCPWDYSDAKLNYKGIIRLDYAPLWFLVGLLFEKIITNKKNQNP